MFIKIHERNRNYYIHELRPTIREFYNVRDLEAIDKIGINRALSFIDDPYKADVRLL